MSDLPPAKLAGGKSRIYLLWGVRPPQSIRATADTAVAPGTCHEKNDRECNEEKQDWMYGEAEDDGDRRNKKGNECVVQHFRLRSFWMSTQLRSLMRRGAAQSAGHLVIPSS